MQVARDQFIDNIERSRQLGAIFSAISLRTTSVVDLEDILRAELVLAVSAFDHFIHELTRIGIIEIYRRSRPQTPNYLQFQVSMDSVHYALADPSSIDWLEDDVRARLGWQSFQSSRNVADAIRLISDKSIWDEVGTLLNQNPHAVTGYLNLIVDRRNKIAHEADMEPNSQSSRWPIDEVTVNEAVDFLRSLGLAIYTMLQTK